MLFRGSKAIWLLTTLLLATVSSAVPATALFSADSSASLTITGITNLDTPGDLADLEISGDAFISLFDEFTDGFALASASGVASVDAVDIFALGVGDGLTQSSSTSGDADPTGVAFATHITDGLIVIDNSSATDTFSVDFVFMYSLSGLVSVDDAASEFSSASAFVDLLSFSGLIDEVFEIVVDTDFGPLSDSFGDTLTFSLTIGPDSFDEISLFVDADGIAFAEAQVSEPSTLLLLSVLGLMVSIGRRRYPQPRES